MKPDRSLLSILKTISKALDHFREFLFNQGHAQESAEAALRHPLPPIAIIAKNQNEI